MTVTAANPVDPGDKNSDPASLPKGKFGQLDLSQFRVLQDGVGEVQTQRILTAVRVGKPVRTAFFRVHHDPVYRMQGGVIEFGAGGVAETYLVAAALHEALLEEAAFSQRLLVTAVTQTGTPFIWPLKVGDNSWTLSAHDAAEIATRKWIRINANMELGAYEVHAAVNQSREPVWPEQEFTQLLNLGFRGRVIDAPDHPVLRQLRGE